jgi:hypothetical protein
VSGEWQPTVQLSPSGIFSSATALAVDRTGNAVAVWTEKLGEWPVRAAMRPAASGTWEQPVQIGSRARGDDVAAAMDDHGNAVGDAGAVGLAPRR